MAGDIVGRIMAYESGEMSEQEAVALIADLIRTGVIGHLQGTYQRTAADLVNAGRIDAEGNVLGEHTVRALVVEPDSTATVTTVGADGDALRGIVGGWLEGVGSHVGDTWHAYCDEEGKIKNKPLNVAATRLARYLGWPPGDVLVGTVVFLGSQGSEEADVPDDVVAAATTLGYLR